MSNDERPRPRPSELASELVERFVANPAGDRRPLTGGELWLLKTLIADAIRRERVVIFKLRDGATAAAEAAESLAARITEPPTDNPDLQAAARAREAVEESLTAEDLDLPRFNAPPFLHVPSARIACLDIRELTPGRLTFEFEDNYTGKGYSLTFDAKSEVICLAKLEGASADQLGAMIRFALEDLKLRREKGDGQ